MIFSRKRAPRPALNSIVDSLQRVVIVGTSGSGKTTMARELSVLLGTPHIELDALQWLPGWQSLRRARPSFARTP